MQSGHKFVRFAVSCVAATVLGTLASSALAGGTNYTDGPVVNVASIRTTDGHFDDYMKWLATTWKQQEEAAKKAGLILSYHIYTAEPHGPNDADIYMVIEFKNWAALDGLGDKLDAVNAKIEGSLDKANQAQAERAKIRTVLGSETLQEALLK
jgi:hypothetical protein